MPREITDKASLFAAIADLDLISELLIEQNGKLKNAADLEVIAQGRDYGNGKRVGPYMRLLDFDGGESIMQQGEWGGNTFYISVNGELDVYLGNATGEQRKIGSIQPGTCFGEMAVLAGVERNATVTVPADGTAKVLELTRPALRLLRKLPKFGQQLDETYRAHGFDRLMEDLGEVGQGELNKEIVAKLRDVARFSVYGKHHVLCEEGSEIDKIFLIKSGWVRRVRGVPFDPSSTGVSLGLGETIGADFLGAGNCLGLEGARENKRWSFSASLMSRSEVLEIPIAALAEDAQLRDHLVAAFSSFSNVDDQAPTIEMAQDLRSLASAESEITTGIVDAANLLVMDMDLCMRCGNCSLACHKVHGQSRLLRRGIHITRPVGIQLKQTQHVLSPQVCMHCKDPECLTGCPTGAIFRILWAKWISIRQPVLAVSIAPHNVRTTQSQWRHALESHLLKRVFGKELRRSSVSTSQCRKNLLPLMMWSQSNAIFVKALHSIHRILAERPTPARRTVRQAHWLELTH